ncbi:hypothetical protein ES703_48588 [subsurface metagenome]
MPPIIAGVHLAYRGKYWLGGLMLSVSLSLQILVVHPQITYYTFLIVLFYGLFELVSVIREKRYKQFLSATGTLVLAAMLAIASNSTYLWTTYEYGKYSTRGESELSVKEDVKTSGLDKDYATDWSYGIAETFTLIIPNFHGGASAGPLPENSKTFEFLKKVQGASQARKTIKQMPTYWGKQMVTSGPVYAGAIVIFLFVLGLMIFRGQLKWWILTVTIFSILLSWGRNFESFNYFLLDHLPYYNKFRTVSMTLVMAEFSISLLAILVLNEIIRGNLDNKKLLKSILQSFYIVGGLCLFFIIAAPMLFIFEADIDQRYLEQGATDFVNALQTDRLMLLRRDAFRSLVFIALATGIFYAYIHKKVKLNYFIAGLGLLILIDMWGVNKRYVNNDDFVSKREYKNPISKSAADEYILRDSDLSYRVLNLAVSPFQDGTTSYYHKSIGGYHGAKMQRFQELVDFEIFPEMQLIVRALQQGSMSLADSALQQCNALNMLNMRYFIYNPEAMPLINRNALGNAWFASELLWAESADEEIAMLGKIDVNQQVVVDHRFKDLLKNISFENDTTTSQIELISYAPNKLVYNSSSSKKQVVVFSEIYYPKGWEVYIDGQKSSHFRANYVLRAMVVPEGEHKIEFYFEPRSYYTGSKIAYASSGLLLLLIIGTLIYELYKFSQRKD